MTKHCLKNVRWRTLRKRSPEAGALIRSNHGWSIEERLWSDNATIVDHFLVTDPKGVSVKLYNGLKHAKRYARNRRGDR
jgi:hypothetical protein